MHCLKMQKTVHGKDTIHPDIASTLNNLGNSYTEMEDYQEAVKLHIQSLKMKKAIHGINTTHPDIASSLGNLGHCYMKMGNYQEAAMCYVTEYGHEESHG